MKLHTSLIFAAGLGTFVALATTASHAILYKWTDENGRVAYGDQPPPGAKPERLNTSIGPADPKSRVGGRGVEAASIGTRRSAGGGFL